MQSCKVRTKKTCPPSRVALECPSPQDDRGQIFPQDFTRNFSLKELRAHIGDSHDEAYSYVMTSVRLDESKETFQQLGCGPNFEGGYLTLCTCKHQMRSGLPDNDKWKKIWIAGFTSRKYCDYNWLFFLTQVEHAYPSQNALWNALSPTVQQKKSSVRSPWGDLYEPKGKACRNCHDSDCQTCFDPRSYLPPMIDHCHAQDDGWTDDIVSNYYNRRAALLVGNPRMTLLWMEPRIRFRRNHPRTKKWADVAGLLETTNLEGLNEEELCSPSCRH